jgi:hypothetical protein
MTLTKDLLEMLPAFPKLTSLIIYGTKITNEGLEIIGKLLPNLKKLNLSYNYEFTNEGLVYLPAGLTFLNLNDCHGITDEGLEFIGQRLPNLKKLYLFDCYEISDKGIKLLKNLKLEELNISRLYKLTTENFLKSVKDMPLTYLKIYDTSINPQARQYLKDRAQQQGRTLVIK